MRTETKAVATHTPGPWETDELAIRSSGPTGRQIAICNSNMRGLPTDRSYDDAHDEAMANARLIAELPTILDALKASEGYLLNAKIDLETGAPRSTAIRTIDGGLRIVRAALKAAEGAQ